MREAAADQGLDVARLPSAGVGEVGVRVREALEAAEVVDGMGRPTRAVYGGLAVLTTAPLTLSVEHHKDLIPRLDGAHNLDRPDVTTVMVTTVMADLGGSGAHDGVLVPHSSAPYEQTAGLLETRSDPSLHHVLDSFEGFFAGPGLEKGAAVSSRLITDFQISRETP